MDVSNSSDQNTGYRVMGSGGAAPIHWKIKPNQQTYKEGDKEYVKIGNLWHEVLAKGTLKACTYVRLEVPDTHDACNVLFSPKGKKDIRFQVSKIKKSGHEKLLVALIPNGNGDPKPVLCRRAA